jgi:hypothetical protein
MTTKQLIGQVDRFIAVVAGMVFFGSLALLWRLNSVTGNRTGFDLLPLPWNDEEFRRLKLKVALRPANDGRWLWFLIVAFIVLTGSLLARRHWVAIGAGVAALGFLFLVRRVLQADFVRQFGEDSLGRFSERETWSVAGVGFYVAFGAIVVNICVAVFGAVAQWARANS